MAYNANELSDYAQLMRELPFKIIPGEEKSLRSSIFLERAIVSERIRLAMGFSLRPLDESVPATEGLEHGIIADKYYEPPLINVIKFACNGCPEKVIKVTEMCQGCLAHPCQEVCPKHAISFRNGKSHIDQSLCVKCGRCVNSCPYSAIVKTERPIINIGRQVLGNLFSEYRDQFTACYNRKDTTGMREWSTRMDNLLLDVDRLLSCDATLSIGKWLQDARDCGTTVSEKDYYEENARCILTVWGQQDTQLNDYANRGWGGLTRSFYRERWKRFTDGVIGAVSKNKPFDEDKFHQDITQFEYNWTLQKDSFPIVSEEDPIQIADSLILKYDTDFTKAQ